VGIEVSEAIVTKLTFLQGYKFRVKFDMEEMPELLVDEPKPTGEGQGPNPTRLLSVAVGHCLSTSLLYCLRKTRIEAKGVETTIEMRTMRNEEGHLRVRNIDVRIRLDVDEKDRARMSRCIEIFENYCTTTQSVRRGIDIKVKVE